MIENIASMYLLLLPVWLRERMDALKLSVTEQIEALFGDTAGLEVLGRRRAAASLARSSGSR